MAGIEEKEDIRESDYALLDLGYDFICKVLRLSEKDKQSHKKERNNIFDIFASGVMEILSVDILAWLMDPKGSHCLGDRFLKAFLAHVFSEDELGQMKTSAFMVKKIGEELIFS